MFHTIFKYLFSKISHYSVASTNEAAFVIGGYDGSLSLDVIAQFKDNEWSLYGNLKKGRFIHGSVTYSDKTMVIGGFVDDGP